MKPIKYLASSCQHLSKNTGKNTDVVVMDLPQCIRVQQDFWWFVYNVIGPYAVRVILSHSDAVLL